MNKKPWIIVFAIALIVHLAGILVAHPVIQLVSKPFIVMALMGYFIAAAKRTALNKWIWLALFFSWAGDVLLLFQEKGPLFFLLGLSAFLLAHAFYILFFHGIRIKEAIAARWYLLVIVAVYYTILITLLSDHLSDMKLPVRMYGVVISFMFLLALHMLFLQNKRAGRLMMFGALLFVVSDSVLAFNKFYEPFRAAGLIVMLTYGLAQLFLVQGAVKYITSMHKG